MPSYITDQELAQVRTGLGQSARSALLEAASRRSPEGSTFLSHSTADAELLPAVVSILEEHGANVYLDKKDKSLPPYTSPATALALRQRIAKCRKFVLFATTHSKESKWMPWELGIADGMRSGVNIAILPSVNNATDKEWTEREYLGVYDRIVRGRLQGHPAELWMVWNFRENLARPLRDWLSAS
jgi:hypothetical protein